MQSLCSSVLGIAISIGAIQKVIDQASAAVAPIYEHIGKRMQSEPVNGVDETSWRQNECLKWKDKTLLFQRR